MAANDRTLEDHQAWIAQVDEAPLEPELPILDPHHHLWLDQGHTGWPYPLDAFRADTGAGHNVVRSIYLDCHANYLTSGPEHLRSVGEVEWVASLAAEPRAPGETEIAGIVGNADVSRGHAVKEVLEALNAASQGLFRGVRYICAQDDHPPLNMGSVPAMDDPDYLAGVQTVGSMGFSYDAMVYHPQLPELASVARACPNTPIVIDHLGGILGTGPYSGRREEILAFWYRAMADLAACPNTYLKAGGIGMPMMGFRWDKQDRPATSQELAHVWAEPIQRVIELFGPDRCMFESNFPVDKRGAGYVVLWNAFKRIAKDFSPTEKRNLFHDSAARAYRVELLGKSV